MVRQKCSGIRRSYLVNNFRVANCNLYESLCQQCIIWTSEGVAVVDRGLVVRLDDILLAILDGRSYFGKVM